MKFPKIDSCKSPTLFFKLFALCWLFFVFVLKTEAQIAVIGGVNFSNVRSDVSLENKDGLTAYHFGVSVQYYPIKSLEKLSLTNEVIFSQKGYQQSFAEDYTFRFNYLALPVLVNYTPHPFFSVQGGVELSQLASTNIKRGMKTYRHFDTGLVLGISVFDNSRVSFYTRATYGLRYMLDYVLIDEMGNFDGDINDIYNVCFSAGIKIKLRDEKIAFGK